MSRVPAQIDLRFLTPSCNTISSNMADEEEESSSELILQRHKKEAKELQGITNFLYLMAEKRGMFHDLTVTLFVVVDFLLVRDRTAASFFIFLSDCTASNCYCLHQKKF